MNGIGLQVRFLFMLFACIEKKALYLKRLRDHFT